MLVVSVCLMIIFGMLHRIFFECNDVSVVHLDVAIVCLEVATVHPDVSVSHRDIAHVEVII